MKEEKQMYSKLFKTHQWEPLREISKWTEENNERDRTDACFEN